MLLDDMHAVIGMHAYTIFTCDWCRQQSGFAKNCDGIKLFSLVFTDILSRNKQCFAVCLYCIA